MRTLLLICVSLVAVMLVGCGSYEVLYTAELKEKDSCIKFEDAMLEIYEEDELVDVVEACLGEDGAEEADIFLIGLDEEPVAVEVSVKAGKCRDKDIPLVPTDPSIMEGDGCDFHIMLLGPIPIGELPEGYEGNYALIVISDDDNRTPALSNIMICFDGEGRTTVTVLSPEEGEYPAMRADESVDTQADI